MTPVAERMHAAMKYAAKISEPLLPVALTPKESRNRGCEIRLAQGVRFERRLFHSGFAIEDRKEGMAAFIEKRKPVFRNRRRYTLHLAPHHRGAEDTEESERAGTG